MTKYRTKPVVIRDLFDKDTHATILRFINDFVPLLPLQDDLNDVHNPRRFGRRYGHNLPFFVDVHKQLADFASDLFCEKVKPSYAFLSMYEPGGGCPLHVDRPQCRYTIDYLIQQEQTEPWPICISDTISDSDRDGILIGHPETDEDVTTIKNSQNWHECLLEPNDAVCYSGTHAWHYRPTLTVGKVDLAFFHFVPVAFDGDLS